MRTLTPSERERLLPLLQRQEPLLSLADILQPWLRSGQLTVSTFMQTLTYQVPQQEAEAARPQFWAELLDGLALIDFLEKSGYLTSLLSTPITDDTHAMGIAPDAPTEPATLPDFTLASQVLQKAGRKYRLSPAIADAQEKEAPTLLAPPTAKRSNPWPWAGAALIAILGVVGHQQYLYEDQQRDTSYLGQQVSALSDHQQERAVVLGILQDDVDDLQDQVRVVETALPELYGKIESLSGTQDQLLARHVRTQRLLYQQQKILEAMQLTPAPEPTEEQK